MALADRIDAIESAYEFMLAYAAQGRRGDGAASDEVREQLRRAIAALDGLAEACGAEAAAADGAAAALGAFLDVLSADAAKAAAAFRLVFSLGSISSQTVDNLNASIHVRALLTDLFLVDGIVHPGGTV
ncbi:MAG TPA: hypothetical protein VHD15_07295 [Hyphomicrobiales bacterium]|nr:hypothetical protein [Hyphomicrobiales bacterium]